MRQRRGVQHGVAGHHLLHVGRVGEAHEREVAVREHRALRAPGGAAGVEDPREVGRRDVDARDRGAREQPRPVRAARHDPRRHRAAVLAQRLVDALLERLAGDDGRRAAVADDVGPLPRVQLRVGGHRAQAADPAAEQRGQELGPVLHADDHPVPRSEAERAPQPAREARRLVDERAERQRPVGPGLRRPLGGDARAVDQRGGDVHVPVSGRGLQASDGSAAVRRRAPARGGAPRRRSTDPRVREGSDRAAARDSPGRPADAAVHLDGVGAGRAYRRNRPAAGAVEETG